MHPSPAQSPSAKPLQLERWGAGLPAAAVLPARMAVVAAPALHGVLEVLCSGEGVENLPPLPSLPEWLRFYHDHGRLHDVLVDVVFPAAKGEPRTSEVFRNAAKRYRALCRMPPEERKAQIAAIPESELLESWRQARQVAGALQQDQHKAIRRDIAGESPAADEALWQGLFHAPELQFLLRVWMPCILLYGKYPTQLMRAARHGDIEALCDLLRLDKAAIAEPRIAQEFAASHGLKRRARFRRLAKALASPIKSPTLKQVKSGLAGFISKACASLGRPVDAPVIQQLFDAVQQDYGRGNSDPHIPAGETFAKRLQRQRPRWKFLPGAPQAHPDTDRPR